MKKIITDPNGKPSNIRAVSLLTTCIAGVLALAPLWGGPKPDWEIVIIFLGGPALKVWQATKEQRR